VKDALHPRLTPIWNSVAVGVGVAGGRPVLPDGVLDVAVTGKGYPPCLALVDWVGDVRLQQLQKGYAVRVKQVVVAVCGGGCDREAGDYSDVDLDRVVFGDADDQISLRAAIEIVFVVEVLGPRRAAVIDVRNAVVVVVGVTHVTDAVQVVIRFAGVRQEGAVVLSVEDGVAVDVLRG